MELNEALRRTVGQHRALLALCLLVGLGLAFVFAPHGTEYSASARLVLDLPDPVARQQSQAYSDTAKAIATSPSQVKTALRRAHLHRGDPVEFAKKHVSVTGLGSSGVIQLAVTDRNPRAAAAIANALASLLIQTRLKVSDGQSEQVFADLDRRTANLSEKISAAQDTVNRLSLRIAAGGSPALRAKRDTAQRTLDFLVQQRSVLESERVSLLSATAERPRPSIISVATPPTAPEPSHRTVYIVLGLLLGLIGGIGLAGLRETIQPTVVGGDTLAGELDAALLGTFDSRAASANATEIGARLRLAAEAADVGNVALVAAGEDIDLDGVAKALNASVAAQPVHTNGNGDGHDSARRLRIAAFSPLDPPSNNGARSGVVLVSRPVLKKTRLNDAAYLLKASRLPLLGVIAYDAPKRRIRRSEKSGTDA
jgi:capsular polysaccharide biosynthesis protein